MITKVRVGSLNYTIREKRKLRHKGNKYYGLQNRKRTEILIYSRMSETHKAHVVLHEIIHAMLQEFGYRDHDEELVESLTAGFMNLYRDNPHLFEYIDKVYADG